ncbi:hypothetical protein GXM_02517 [Nostoc sphaeroides CCNUC1]|uniref:Uncharacterized protein n=1 Tax=Nostoc sphaeroides CCNUC1 TaxID=2653204 RepID=A0A5P8VXA3_9NOSO|nr:hypothetical protein GXM_02517 [Nostoc sphaeroides CCNUC1]
MLILALLNFPYPHNQIAYGFRFDIPLKNKDSQVSPGN